MKRTGLQSTIGILLIAVILVLANLIANTRFLRLDLTEGHIFSLSKASKAVVGDLDEPLTVKVFASENLSPKLNDVKRFFNDLLSGYRAYGKGKFRYEFVNPASDDKLEKEAQDYRIPPFQENVWNKDKLELKKVYLGAVFLYGDKQETIPTLQSTTGLEYSVTSLIKRITSQQDMKVGFLTSNGEPDPFKDMKQATNVLQGNYKVTSVDLSKEDKVPDDVNALLIIGPTSDIPDDQQLKIDQYVMNGGKVGWFFSPITTDLQRGYASDSHMKLGQFTTPYGFRVNNDLVADKNSAMINIQERRGFFTIQNTVNYPFFPTITTFNKDNPVVRDLDQVNLFFASSIDSSLAKQAGVKMIPLMFSGDRSLVQSGRFDINATNKWQDSQFDRGHLLMAAALKGPFNSRFLNADLPKDENGNPLMPADSFKTKSTDDARMVVVGCSNFLQDPYLSNPTNIYFLLNSVDWMVGDTDLIKLRTREVQARPLKEISDSQKAFWKYFNWFGPPLLAIILGLVYWQVRRNRRYEEL